MKKTSKDHMEAEVVCFHSKKPSKEEAEEAVRILIQYIGDDANREGLLETPTRVIKSFEEIYAGYKTSEHEILNKKFFDVQEYNNLIILKAINFSSICEHHMLPFHGTVDIAYIPSKVVLGLSKLARIVEVFAKRLQLQERLNIQIANSLQKNLNPLGVAVRVRASHSCMSMRGVKKHDSYMETFHYTGIFEHEPDKKKEFLSLIS